MKGTTRLQLPIIVLSHSLLFNRPQRIRRLLVPDTSFWQRYGGDYAQTQLEARVLDLNEYEEEQKRGLQFINPFDAYQLSSELLREDRLIALQQAFFADEHESEEDCLGRIRELLGMNDKSNIEAVYECQRVEGREKPTGIH